MAKTSSKPRNKTTATAPTKKTTTLSIRLTDKEKALIATAAGLQNDRSPTAFIKSAALTKAAHVINTKTENSFDFKALGERLVTLLLDDFPKQFLAKLTPKGQADYAQKIEDSIDDPFDDAKLPIDIGEGFYSPVMAKEHYSLMDRDDYVTAGYESWLGAEFERGNPKINDESQLWISIDQIPEGMMPTEEQLRDYYAGTPGEHPGEDPVDSPWNTDIPEAAPVVRDKRQKLTVDEFDALRRAIHLGGSEFMETLIQTAMEKYPVADEERPTEPIDPDTL
jgi:uncharacterized protein (DUF1778 family)